MESRDDDRGADDDEDDERADPEDAAPDALSDLARWRPSRRRRESPPERRLRTLASGGPRRRPGSRPGLAPAAAVPRPGPGRPGALRRLLKIPTRRATITAAIEDDVEELHASASRNTSERRRRSKENCVTRPARIAARRTSSLSTELSSTRRTAPPSTSDTVTPGRWRAQLGGPVALDADHQPPGPLVANSSTVPDDDQAAVVDDRHLLAEVLHLVELVAAEEHAAPGPGLVDQHLADGVDAGGVEPRQRLVQHEQFGVVHERRRQLHPLLVPVRQRLHLGVPAVGDVEPLEPGAGGGSSLRRAEPVQPAQVLDLLADEHARVQPALLGHVTEAAALSLAHRRAVPPDGPGIEVGETEDGPHRRRLARTVRPEEADDLSGRHVEGEVVEGGHGSPYVRRSPSSSSNPATSKHPSSPVPDWNREGSPTNIGL